MLVVLVDEVAKVPEAEVGVISRSMLSEMERVREGALAAETLEEVLKKMEEKAMQRMAQKVVQKTILDMVRAIRLIMVLVVEVQSLPAPL